MSSLDAFVWVRLRIVPRKGDLPMTSNHITRARFCLAVRRNASLALCLAICALGLAISASAQEPRIITFDAPGADTNTGDFNGTYPSGINVEGFITGSYQGADTVLHGFLRSPGGKFTAFEAPGADTTAGSYNGTSPTSINDLGVITGSFHDATGLAHASLRFPDGNFRTFAAPAQVQMGHFPSVSIS